MAEQGHVVLVCGRAPERSVCDALDAYRKAHGIAALVATSNAAAFRWSLAHEIPRVVATPDVVICMPGYRGKLPEGVPVLHPQ